jgi:lambda family phage portal protein
MEPFRVRVRVKSETSARPTASLGSPSTRSSGYEAAGVGPRLSRWFASRSGPNALLGAALPNLRARSRDIVRQNGLADGIIWSVMVPNIVGTGIRPQWRTGDSGLDRDLAELFDIWTDESDADGGLDFFGQQALAVASALEGGDVFIRMRTRLPGDGLSVPLQLQLLEAEFCPESMWQMSTSGNEIRAGIELDSIGRRAAYWLYRRHPNDMWSAGVGDTSPAPIAARDVAHMRFLRRPGLLRGEPWLTRALVKLHDLDEYDDAQLLRQKIAAMFAGFVTSTPDEDARVDGQQDQGDPPVADDGTMIATLDPGTMQELAPGQTVNFSTPPKPGDDYADYKRDQHRLVAIAAGILYEQLTGDYGLVNDRTWRAAVNEFRRRCGMWQHHIVVQQSCRPVLARWADLAMLSGAIRLPRSVDPARVRRASWVPQAWSYINPVQDVQAKRDEIRAGFKSRRGMVSEAGDDVEQIDAEIAADNARADRDGLSFDSDGRRAIGKGEPTPPEPEPAPVAPKNRRG